MIKERKHPETLAEAIRHFADKETAFAFVVQLRWPDGVSCPHCSAEKPMLIKTRMIWKCRACRKQFSVKRGTIFEDSALGLDKWLPALWMLANSKNGISSYELGRALGVTQKSAWFMLSRIRLAMQTKTFQKMKGAVEIDETFVGGIAQNMHHEKKMRPPKKGSGVKGKVAVLGILERNTEDKHSRVKLDIVRNVRRKTLLPIIQKAVEQGTDVYTDKLNSYNVLNEQFKHAAIDHAESYVEGELGEIHTNGLENFWSLLKRAIKGTYVSVDPFHLWRYLDEQAFRFNHRGLKDFGRFREVVSTVLGKRLTYADLIATKMLPATT
jgi:transposase-like protein